MALLSLLLVLVLVTWYLRFLRSSRLGFFLVWVGLVWFGWKVWVEMRKASHSFPEGSGRNGEVGSSTFTRQGIARYGVDGDLGWEGRIGRMI